MTRTDKKCPYCNAMYEESCFTNTSVKCAECGGEILLRTPLQKRKESIILKYELLSLKHYTILAAALYLVFVLPILLYVIFTETTISTIFAMHPVAFIIYSIILLMSSISLVFMVLLSISHALVKKNTDYQLDKLKVYKSQNKISKFLPIDSLIKKAEDYSKQ